MNIQEIPFNTLGKDVKQTANLIDIIIQIRVFSSIVHSFRSSSESNLGLSKSEFWKLLASLQYSIFRLLCVQKLINKTIFFGLYLTTPDLWFFIFSQSSIPNSN